MTREGYRKMRWIAEDPDFDPLRGDPRFAAPISGTRGRSLNKDA